MNWRASVRVSAAERRNRWTSASASVAAGLSDSALAAFRAACASRSFRVISEISLRMAVCLSAADFRSFCKSSSLNFTLRRTTRSSLSNRFRSDCAIASCTWSRAMFSRRLSARAMTSRCLSAAASASHFSESAVGWIRFGIQLIGGFLRGNHADGFLFHAVQVPLEQLDGRLEAGLFLAEQGQSFRQIVRPQHGIRRIFEKAVPRLFGRLGRGQIAVRVASGTPTG